MKGMLLSVLLLAGIVSAFPARADASYAATLQNADSVRSVDVDRFESLLKELDARKREASKEQVLWLQFLVAYDLGSYQDRASQGSQLAQDVYRKTSDPVLKFRAGGLVASFSAVTRDFGTGLRFLEQILELRSKIKDKSTRNSGLGVAAMLYNQMGQYRIGLKYADEMLRDDPDPRVKCAATHFRVESLFALGRAAGEKQAIEDGVSLCQRIGEKIAASLLRDVQARMLANEGDVAGAIALLEKTLPEAQSTRYPVLIAKIRSSLAELKLRIGNETGAESDAKEAISNSERLGSTAAIVSAYHTLYEISAKRERPTKALEYYRLYAEADKAHQSDVKARELAYEIVRNETQQKNKEIELLQQTNQVLRLRQSLDRENAQKARLATIFLLILLAGIVFWAVQIKRHHRQLQKLAQTDSLTGLGNRHFFTQMSERSLVEAARAGEPASLVMFDLDHFKAINDTYGHGAGDWVLKQVGKTCSAHCRKIDYLGRIGGEEFAVLLRGIDLSSATRVAEDCRVQLAKIDTRECGYSFVVTGSFGVSSTAQSGYDLSRLLSHADQMLYRAKNEGRNRVCAYTADAAIDHRSSKRAPTLSIVNS